MKKFINQIMEHILIYGEDPDFNNIPWKKLDFIRGGNMFQIEVKYLGINFAKLQASFIIFSKSDRSHSSSEILNVFSIASIIH